MKLRRSLPGAVLVEKALPDQRVGRGFTKDAFSPSPKISAIRVKGSGGASEAKALQST